MGNNSSANGNSSSGSDKCTREMMVYSALCTLQPKSKISQCLKEASQYHEICVSGDVSGVSSGGGCSSLDTSLGASRYNKKSDGVYITTGIPSSLNTQINTQIEDKTIVILVIKLYEGRDISIRKTIQFTVQTTDTIASLKIKYNAKESIPEHKQKISFNGIELLNGYLIGHFITSSGGELFLMERS